MKVQCIFSFIYYLFSFLFSQHTCILWMRKIKDPVGYRDKDKLKTKLITHKEIGQYILAEKFIGFCIRKDLYHGVSMDLLYCANLPNRQTGTTLPIIPFLAISKLVLVPVGICQKYGYFRLSYSVNLVTCLLDHLCRTGDRTVSSSSYHIFLLLLQLLDQVCVSLRDKGPWIIVRATSVIKLEA